MKLTILFSIIASSLLSPLLLAQSPVVVSNPMAIQQAKAQYLSSNTVRAVFKGVRVLNHVRLQDLLTPNENPLPGEKVAIFEVIEALAFQAESSLLSNRMMKGDLFSVDLSGQRHGQSPEAISMAGELQEGEEVVVKMDEYMTETEREGQLVISSASRMARRNAVADVQAEDPDAFAPQGVAMPRVNQASTATRAAVTLNPSHLTRNSKMTRISNHNGQMQRIEVRQEGIPGTNQMRTRMFINGVEVDPVTQQPLQAATPTAPAQNDTSNEAEIPSPEPSETF